MRALVIVVALAACGDDSSMSMVDAPTPGDAMPDGMDMPGDPTAAELTAATDTCMRIAGDYSIDNGEPATVPICGLTGAVFWRSDLDVDCDGKETTKCNLMTDGAYQNQTAAVDSNGDPLDAAALPYVVVPLKSTRWDYRASDLALGSVVAVVYKDKVEYGVIGDLGPTSIIGEASYRMAELLGIDPDPSTGGTDETVTYIAFSGMTAEVMTMEDHDEARMIGIAHAKMLLGR